MLRRLGEAGGVLNTDMTVIRRRWMQEMAVREIALLDGQLLGHAINSASFFASSNLLLIAAAAGVLFGGERSFASLSSLELVQTSTRMMFELQMAVILVVLARGLLAFIWSIRQMNYCLTLFGATPEGQDADPALREPVRRYLDQERAAVRQEMDWLAEEFSPFKAGG